MKLTITIDLKKIDKSRITERTYQKDGETIVCKDYKMDIVPLKEKKVIKEGDTWSLVKSHFVCDSATKEEREQKVKTNFLGDGIGFEDKNPTEEVINVEDVAF